MLKSIFLILTLIISLPILSQTLTEVENFGDNPGKLKAFVHVPEKSDSVMPLVIALHGCSQTASSMAEQSGWNMLADRYGFMVLYPQQSWTNNVSNCFNWFRSADIEGEKGELASIHEMIQYVMNHYNVNQKRVFIYGLSAGAAMSVAAMSNYPSLFQSGAIFAGGPYKMATNAFAGAKVMIAPPDLTPQEWGEKVTELHKTKMEYPKIIVVHGDRDNVVDIRCSYELIDQWSDLHNLDPVNRSVLANYAGNPLVTKNIIGQDEAVVTFYEISDIGHALAVDPGDGEKQGGKTGIYADDIDFFSTYYIAKDFGIIPNEE